MKNFIILFLSLISLNVLKADISKIYSDCIDNNGTIKVGLYKNENFNEIFNQMMELGQENLKDMDPKLFSHFTSSPNTLESQLIRRMMQAISIELIFPNIKDKINVLTWYILTGKAINKKILRKQIKHQGKKLQLKFDEIAKKSNSSSLLKKTNKNCGIFIKEALEKYINYY